MRKLKQLSILLILLIGVFFLFQKCQKKEESINLDQKTKLSFNRLSIETIQKKQQLKSSIKKIQKYFDVNRADVKDFEVGDFTILTDEVVQVLTDSSETYSFHIQTPTDTLSTFENFVIDVKDGFNLYFIAKYKYFEGSTNDYPDYISVQPISEDQIDIGDFQEHISKEMDDGCYELILLTNPIFEEEWVWMEVDCPTGGSGDSSEGDDSSGDPYSNTEENSGEPGGGNSSNSSSNSNNSTTGINPPIPYDQQIQNCLELSPIGGVGGFNYNDWLNDENTDYYDIKDIADFLNFGNNCSDPLAQEFAIAAMQALAEEFHETTFDEFLQLIEDEQDYKDEMSVSELAIFESLDRNKQLKYLQSAFNAKTMSANLYPPTPSEPCNAYNGQGDAFRHAFWNALCRVRLGESLTEQLTTAHENKPATYLYSYKEVQMDLYNNAKGREIAFGSGLLWELVKFSLDNGEFKHLSNLDASCKATNTSLLIPTN